VDTALALVPRSALRAVCEMRGPCAAALLAAVALLGRVAALSPARFNEAAPLTLQGTQQLYSYDFTLAAIGTVPYGHNSTCGAISRHSCPTLAVARVQQAQ